MKNSTLYAVDLAAFILSIGCATSGNQLLSVPPAVAGLGISGYLVAKIPKREDLKLINEAKICELEAKLNEIQGITNWQQQLLESSEAKKLEEVEALKHDYESRLVDVQDTLQSLSKSKDEEISMIKHNEAKKLLEISEQHRLEKAEVELAFTNRISELESQLISTLKWRDDVLKLESDLVKMSEQLKLDEKALRLEEKRVRLDVRSEREDTKKLLQESQLEIKAQSILIERLQSEITSLKAQNEQLFTELYAPKSDKVEDELLTIIQSTLAQNGVPTEFISRSNNNNVEVIKLKPSNYFEPSKLTTTAEILPALVDIPKPIIEAKKGTIQVKIDRRNDLDKISDAPQSWLEKLCKDAEINNKNFALMGARGGGKSELMKNLCGLIVKDNPDVEIFFLQPKIDDFSVFKVGDKLFEPDFVGFEKIVSDSGRQIPSSYDGILFLRDLYSERNSINQKAFANNEPTPKFSKAFFLIDEAQLLISREKEFVDPEILKSEKLRPSQSFCGKIIRDSVSLGRSLNIIVLVVSQLPNPSIFGFLKSDLLQFISIVMAANVGEFVENFAPTKEEKARILGELELWRKRATNDDSKKYFAYIKQMEKAGYLALLPTPGTYLN